MTRPASISESAYSLSVQPRASARWRSLMLCPFEPGEIEQRRAELAGGHDAHVDLRAAVGDDAGLRIARARARGSTSWHRLTNASITGSGSLAATTMSTSPIGLARSAAASRSTTRASRPAPRACGRRSASASGSATEIGVRPRALRVEARQRLARASPRTSRRSPSSSRSLVLGERPAEIVDRLDAELRRAAA